MVMLNRELLGCERPRANTLSDTIPKLFSHNQAVADLLRTLQVDVDMILEAILAAVGMIPCWCARGEMSVFYTVSNGKSSLLLPPFSFSPSSDPFFLQEKMKGLMFASILLFLFSYF